MYAAIFTAQSTAQVKGAANTMVTVVASQELKAGDVLRRFKAETAQDEPHRGNKTMDISSMHWALFTWFLCFGCCCCCYYYYC